MSPQASSSSLNSSFPPSRSPSKIRGRGFIDIRVTRDPATVCYMRLYDQFPRPQEVVSGSPAWSISLVDDYVMPVGEHPNRKWIEAEINSPIFTHDDSGFGEQHDLDSKLDEAYSMWSSRLPRTDSEFDDGVTPHARSFSIDPHPRPRVRSTSIHLPLLTDNLIDHHIYTSEFFSLTVNFVDEKEDLPTLCQDETILKHPMNFLYASE
ncbi:hypothetical protein EV360DRAFT_88153 [Lentinula raphanica]|nr:hypothetical protein EV360DRAFT_88153 [Lentinula raphanica]